MKVGNSCCFNVFLAQYLHFDWCVRIVEGKVVQEVGEVGGSTVHHRQGVGRRASGVFGKGQLQEFPSKTFHLGRAETGQLIGISMQDRPSTVGLLLLVHEAPKPGARLEAGAADEMVLVGEKKAVSQFESVKMGLVVICQLSGFRLDGSEKGATIWAEVQGEVSSKPGGHGLNSFVVDTSNLSGTALVLLVLLLFLLLLQEIFFQTERLKGLAVGQQIYGGKNKLLKNLYSTYTTVVVY